MELSEAIKKLKETQDSYLKDELDIAIEVVLKALDNRYYEMVMKEQNDIINDLKARLDNSISKDKVRKKIEILDYLQEDAIEENALEDARILEYKIKILQELLGEE